MSDLRTNIGIYKIDLKYFQKNPDTPEIAIDYIVSTANAKSKESKENAEPLKQLELKNAEIGYFNVKVFIKRKYKDGWFEFLSRHLKTQDDRRAFYSSSADILLFFFDENHLYGVSSGSLWTILSTYSEDAFPFEVAKRIFTEETKSATTMNVAGSSMLSKKIFKHDHAYSKWESFGQVFKNLTAKIDLDQLRKYLRNSEHEEELACLLDDWKGEAKASFVVKKAIRIELLSDIIHILQNISQSVLSEDRKKKWLFLDSLFPISQSNQIYSTLFDAFYDQVYGYVFVNDTELTFDICYWKDPEAYLNSTHFHIKSKGSRTFTSPPECKAVLDDSLKFLKKSKSKEDFIKKFKALKFVFKDEEINLHHEKLLIDFFYGEQSYDEKRFLLMDGKWYQVRARFLAELEQEFVNCVFDENILISSIPFVSYRVGVNKGMRKTKKSYKEEIYNTYQATVLGFYFGDRIFHFQKDRKIELFDLIYIDGHDNYIIQVKEGFSSTIREACSQIRMSAEFFEQNFLYDENLINDYHRRWRRQHPANNLDIKQFTDLFKVNNRIYVLAFATKHPFTKNSLMDQTYKSLIARFEILKTWHDLRNDHIDFKIAHISF